MSDLTELLARVEAATGPDRELDGDLAVRLMGWCLHPTGRQRDDSAQSDTGYTCLDCGADSWGNTGPSGQKRHARVPEVTASLDAALALVERVLPRHHWELCWGGPRTRPAVKHAETRPDMGKVWAVTEGSTAPLALLAALLRALSASPSPPSDAAKPLNTNKASQ